MKVCALSPVLLGITRQECIGTQVNVHLFGVGLLGADPRTCPVADKLYDPVQLGDQLGSFLHLVGLVQVKGDHMDGPGNRLVISRGGQRSPDVGLLEEFADIPAAVSDPGFNVAVHQGRSPFGKKASPDRMLFRSRGDRKGKSVLVGEYIFPDLFSVSHFMADRICHPVVFSIAVLYVLHDFLFRIIDGLPAAGSQSQAYEYCK